MKTIFALAVLTGATVATHAQTPRFSPYDLGETGCTLYLPADPVFELTYSEDSSEVWTTEVESGGFNYAAICVHFNDVTESTEEELTELLTTYLDFLQGQFGVTGAAGYGEGHTLGQYPDVYGVLDFWEDVDALQYTVMGWINNEFLTVLIVYGNEQAEQPVYNMYFQGFRLPE